MLFFCTNCGTVYFKSSETSLGIDNEFPRCTNHTCFQYGKQCELVPAQEVK